MRLQEWYVVSTHCENGAHALWRLRGTLAVKVQEYVEEALPDCCVVDCVVQESTLHERSYETEDEE